MAWNITPPKRRGLRSFKNKQRGYILLGARKASWGSRARASFDLPLQTSLIPRLTNGSPTPTFIRATAAYQTDFEGKQNLVLSGEARMQGARRVGNIVVASESPLAGWSHANTTITSGIADPLGGTTAVTLTNASASVTDAYSLTTTTDTRSYVGSIWVRRRTGTGTISLYDASAAQIAIMVTSTWQRFSVLKTGHAAGSTYVGVVINTPGDAVDVAFSQLEDVTGQANQAPANYVSVGVLPAPYHGAGVDGVQNFDTLNGNTVTNNVVTEATGAAINSSQAECAGGVTAGVVDASGPTGYLSEGARTNDILQSNTLGTTWTVSNAADMNAVAADAYVSVDGTTTMDKLQPKATTAVHSLDQAFTFTAAKYTTSADLRYVAATPQRWVALICNDGTTTWGASFDLLNGVAGAVSAGATSAIEATALAGVYRVSVTNTANAAAAAGTVKISLNATDTATLESAARAGTETLGAGMVQHEIGLFKSSRIITTTVAVTRNGNVLTYPSAGNILGTQGTAYAEVVFLGAVVGPNFGVIGSSSESVPLFVRANGALAIYDGTTMDDTAPSVVPLNTLFKGASSWGASGLQIAHGGGTVSSSAFDGDMNIGANFYAGNSSAANIELFGTIRKISLYPVAFPAAKLQAMTTP